MMAKSFVERRNRLVVQIMERKLSPPINRSMSTAVGFQASKAE